MRRSPAHRILGALLALWFALVMGEPVSLHACPMHDGVAAGGSHHAGAMAHASAHHAPAQPGHDGGAHVCSCVGKCCASAVPLAPSAPTVAVHAVEVRDSGLPDHRYTPVARALILPWANGPPAA